MFFPCSVWRTECRRLYARPPGEDQRQKTPEQTRWEFPTLHSSLFVLQVELLSSERQLQMLRHTEELAAALELGHEQLCEL